MAIVKSTEERYSWLTADTPPTVGVASGARGRNTQTGVEYEFNGTAWAKMTISIAEIAAGDTNIGNVDVATIAAGDNNIGNVDIASAIPAGNNNIGDVDVASIATGSNVIGKVGIDQTTPGTTNGVQVNAALPAGTNNIGDMDVLSAVATSVAAALVDTVAAAGSREQLASNAAKFGVMISALPTNTGYVYVGINTVSSSVYGRKLAAGDGFIVPVSNSNFLYIDADVAGEGVSYFAL